MKLVTYATGDGPHAGVHQGDHIVDVARLLGEPSVRDVRQLLELPYDGVDAVRARLGSATGTGRLPIAETRLLAPVLQPPTIRDHITFEKHASASGTIELPDVWYQRPLYYYSGTSRIIGPEETVLPPSTQMLDYELEIAAVVRRSVSDVRPGQAMDAIAGFTIFNDWSARDIQQQEMKAGLGPSKGKDFGSSLGPYVVTVDELVPFLAEDRLHLACQVRVNDALWGTGNAGEMFHSWAEIVAHASSHNRLLPGDVLASGTVAGCCVGDAKRTGHEVRYLSAGDRVEIIVEALGSLANVVG